MAVHLNLISELMTVERELEMPFTVKLPTGRRLVVTEAHMDDDGIGIVIDAAHFADTAAVAADRIDHSKPA